MTATGHRRREGIEGRSDSREPILEAATRVVARDGVRGLRIEQVASEAGVSPALLYYHFGSRSGLISATLGRAARLAPSAAIREPSSKSGHEAVREALLAELSDEPGVRANAVVWGEIGATAVFEPEVRAAVADAWDGWREAVVDGLRRGVADGSITPDLDPEPAAETLISLVDGLCTRWLAGALSRERAVSLLEDQLGRLGSR